MIAGLILAAGDSSRMGRPKLSLPWIGGRAIVAQMVQTLRRGGVDEVIVVTGSDRQEIERALAGMQVILVHNPAASGGGMLSSLQVGVRALAPLEAAAAVITPGDLPALRAETVQQLITAWQAGDRAVTAPSIGGRRGHPLVISASLWDAILALDAHQTLRDLLSEQRGEVSYLIVDDPGVCEDIDTPQAYQRALQRAQEGGGMPGAQ